MDRGCENFERTNVNVRFLIFTELHSRGFMVVDIILRFEFQCTLSSKQPWIFKMSLVLRSRSSFRYREFARILACSSSSSILATSKPLSKIRGITGSTHALGESDISSNFFTRSRAIIVEVRCMIRGIPWETPLNSSHRFWWFVWFQLMQNLKTFPTKISVSVSVVNSTQMPPWPCACSALPGKSSCYNDKGTELIVQPQHQPMSLGNHPTFGKFRKHGGGGG